MLRMYFCEEKFEVCERKMLRNCRLELKCVGHDPGCWHLVGWNVFLNTNSDVGNVGQFGLLYVSEGTYAYME